MPLNRRDGNEKSILQFWRAMGCDWTPQPRRSGFDGVLVALNGVHIVEIKNPARKWKFTDAELKKKAAVEFAGGRYNVIQSDDDARRLIGL